MCVKYTVIDRNSKRTISWESSFCGQGTNWNGEVVSSNRCFTENKVEGKDHRVCFCDDLSLCNSAKNTGQYWGMVFISVLVVFVNIF